MGFLTKKFLVLLICMLYIESGVSLCQEQSAYEGRHFYLGFMQNEIADADEVHLEVYITTATFANINVNIPGYPIQFFSIPQDSILKIFIPEEFEITESEVPLKNIIEITSDVPISVFGFNSQQVSSDSYSAIPISRWGQEYVVLSYPNDQYSTAPNLDSLEAFEPRSSEFLVMAANDGTTIEFQPKAVTRAGKQVFRTYTVTLNKGECYLVQSFKAAKGEADLTGTIVRSDKPIGLLSGHVRTAVPQTLGHPWDNKDHIVEMLPPTESWGKMYVSVPFFTNPHGDIFRITNIEPNTTVTYYSPHGPQDYMLAQPGSAATIEEVSEPALWLSDKPFQIGQYMAHSGRDDDNTYFDPCLVVLPPVEQFVQRIIFQTLGNNYNRPGYTQYIAHYIYIVAEQQTLSTLTLDGRLITSFDPYLKLQTIGNTSLHWTQITLTEGKHELKCSNGKFSGVIFGIGNADSYGMILGSSLNNPFKKDSLPPEITVKEKCGIINGTIKEIIDGSQSGLYFMYVLVDSTENYKWQLDSIGDNTLQASFWAEPVDIFKDGRFVIEVRDKNGNGAKYSFNYKGLKVDLPDEIEFQGIGLNDSLCYEFSIENNSDTTLLVDSIYIEKDPRLRVYTDISLPKTLLTGEKINCTVCLETKDDASTVEAGCVIVFDCELMHSIPIRAFVSAPAMRTVGYDFGNIRVGDTSCAEIYIINEGNVKIIIDSLCNVKSSKQFWLDTSGFFPAIIEPAKDFKIPVCFSPDSVGGFEAIYAAVNNYNLSNTITVIGNGIAPAFESVTIDWRKRRVGTENDTTLRFKNSGNCGGYFKFLSYDKVCDAFDTTGWSEIYRYVPQGDSFMLKATFKPTLPVQYDSKTVFEIDWRFHEPVVMELIGEGSLPVINTIDIQFDTTFIFTKKDTTAKILTTGGNESLTIDSIYYFSGDSESFDINLSTLKNLLIEPDSALISAIQFHPTRLGSHELVLEVLHDAAPNYERVKSYIKILGEAIKGDTVNYYVDWESPDDIISCNKNKIYFKIKNTGNVVLSLQQLDLTTNNAAATWSEPLNFPISIYPDSLLVLGIDLSDIHRETGWVRVEAILNDSISIKNEFPIVPRVYSLVLEPYKNSQLKVTPGEMSHLELNGQIPARVDVPFDLTFSIGVDRKNLLLLHDSTIKIFFSSSSGTKKYEAATFQDKEKIILQFYNIELEEKSDWTLDIPIFVLLNDEINYDVSILENSDLCFLPDSITIPVSVENVCTFDLRAVQLIDNSIGEIVLFPNPAKEKININVNLLHDESLKIVIFDKTGKKYMLSEKLFLKKGSHSLIFEISILPSGVFILSVQTSISRKYLMFIITK